jgi:hypothetical protein
MGSGPGTHKSRLLTKKAAASYFTDIFSAASLSIATNHVKVIQPSQGMCFFYFASYRLDYRGGIRQYAEKFRTALFKKSFLIQKYLVLFLHFLL